MAGGDIQTIRYRAELQLAQAVEVNTVALDPMGATPYSARGVPGPALEVPTIASSTYTGNLYLPVQGSPQDRLILPIPPIKIIINSEANHAYCDAMMVRINNNAIQSTPININTTEFYMQSADPHRAVLYANLANITSGSAQSDGGVYKYDIDAGVHNPIACGSEAHSYPPSWMQLTVQWGDGTILSKKHVVCHRYDIFYLGTLIIDYKNLTVTLDTSGVGPDVSYCECHPSDSSDSPCDKGFPGFIKPHHCYKYYEYRDWDSCLFGTDPTNEGGMPYPVDGHVTLKWLTSSTCEVICVTGNYKSRYSKGQILGLDGGYPAGLVASGTAFSDRRRSAANPSDECSNPAGNKIYAQLSNSRPHCPDDSSSSECEEFQVDAPFVWCRAPSVADGQPIPTSVNGIGYTETLVTNPTSLGESIMVFNSQLTNFTVCNGQSYYLEKLKKSAGIVWSSVNRRYIVINVNGDSVKYWRDRPRDVDTLTNISVAWVTIPPGSGPNVPLFDIFVEYPAGGTWNPDWPNIPNTGRIFKKAFINQTITPSADPRSEFSYDNCLYDWNEVLWPLEWTTDMSWQRGIAADGCFNLLSYLVPDGQGGYVNKLASEPVYSNTGRGGYGYLTLTGESVTLKEDYSDPEDPTVEWHYVTWVEIQSWDGKYKCWLSENCWYHHGTKWPDNDYYNCGRTIACSITKPTQGENTGQATIPAHYWVNRSDTYSPDGGETWEDRGKAWLKYDGGPTFFTLNGIHYKVNNVFPVPAGTVYNGKTTLAWTISPCDSSEYPGAPTTIYTDLSDGAEPGVAYPNEKMLDPGYPVSATGSGLFAFSIGADSTNMYYVGVDTTTGATPQQQIPQTRSVATAHIVNENTVNIDDDFE